MATVSYPTMWVDEAQALTATDINTLQNTPYYTYTTTTDETGSYITVNPAQLSGEWAHVNTTDWTIPEPEPEPVFDNLGDFLLHKYNKVKEVPC